MNWVRRHPIWTAVISLALALIAANYFSSRSETSKRNALERMANDCTPGNSQLVEVKTCLLRFGFEVNQMPAAHETLPLYNGRGGEIVAYPGEIPFHARRETTQAGFFCSSWSIEVILTFSSDGRLKQHYVGQSGRCL